MIPPRFRPLLVLAPLVLLAACGKPATGNAMAPATTTPTTNTAASIRDLPEGQRTAVFLRAIRDAGRDCQGVTKATEVNDAGATPTWQATCQDGSQWLVAIGTDGVATVTSRADVRGADGTGNAS